MLGSFPRPEEAFMAETTDEQAVQPTAVATDEGEGRWWWLGALGGDQGHGGGHRRTPDGRGRHRPARC